MDADASNARHGHAIDWLEHYEDLPHLIARVSELVHRLGHDPGDLVVLPRAELDRRELGAYSAAWTDVVDEQLPAIRHAYEERITAAYLQGHEDARTGRRPRRTRRPEGERGGGVGGGEVIPLPYLQLLRPPSELTRVEERGQWGRPVEAGGRPVYDDTGEGVAASGLTSESAPAPVPEAAPDSATEPGMGAVPAADAPVSARELRGKRSASVDRRTVVRRNGRPSVPPLTRAAGDTAGAAREKGRRQQEESDSRGARDEDRPRLSDKARVLAEELESKGRASGRSGDAQGEGVEEGDGGTRGPG
ncbi:hypothetical protein ACQEWB_28630 [Streptomyces sp. CA-249302]|uniref:hypothetical protein n=1 Tax=Streptomyces sp. CA-249302 TaxID=3240058 RepID=UPI003D8CBC4F